ncbi:MAG: type II secretion system F family protein [Acidimicrobiia bacterium]
MLLPIIAALAVGCALVLIVLVFAAAAGEREQVRSSLRQLEDYELGTTREQAMLQPFSERAFAPVVSSMLEVGNRFAPAGFAARIGHLIEVAGFPPGWSIEMFTVFKVLGAASGFLWIPLVFAVLQFDGIIGIAFVVFLWALSFRLPNILLDSLILQRKEQIRRELPDLLDLLTISIEAGLGFEQALDRVCAVMPGALSVEFRRMLQEVRLGGARADALRAVDARTEVPELHSFLMAVLQADTFGVSIGRILRSQSEDARQRRRTWAQEKAQKMPVKLLFPLVLCIFPAVFVIVIGPAVVEISRTL